jgi:hypothetical protein
MKTNFLHLRYKYYAKTNIQLIINIIRDIYLYLYFQTNNKHTYDKTAFSLTTMNLLTFIPDDHLGTGPVVVFGYFTRHKKWSLT